MTALFHEGFLRYLATQEGASTAYQLSVQQSLTELDRYFSEQKIDENHCAEQDIVGFLAWLEAKGWQASSRRVVLVHVRIYFRWLEKKNLVSEDPVEFLPSGKVPKNLPESVGVEVISRLMNYMANKAENSLDCYDLRDWALLELLYAAGLRVSEIIHLQAGDVDLEEQWLRVMGKGSKIREVPFGAQASKAIQKYLELARPKLKTKATRGDLFLTRLGKSMTRERVRQILTARALEAGIAQHFHPHLMRHACATHLLSGGADLRMIQEFLGHASVTTTEIYTHVDISQLTQAYQKFHPRARKNT